MAANKDSHRLEFHLARDLKEIQGFLPGTSINKTKYNEGFYSLKCLDDRIMVKLGSVQEPLDAWFGNIEDSWWKINYNKRS